MNDALRHKRDKTSWRRAAIAIQQCSINNELGILPLGQFEIREINPGVKGVSNYGGWVLQSGLQNVVRSLDYYSWTERAYQGMVLGKGCLMEGRAPWNSKSGQSFTLAGCHRTIKDDRDDRSSLGITKMQLYRIGLGVRVSY
jgi:hypothetical protein